MWSVYGVIFFSFLMTENAGTKFLDLFFFYSLPCSYYVSGHMTRAIAGRMLPWLLPNETVAPWNQTGISNEEKETKTKKVQGWEFLKFSNF